MDCYFCGFIITYSQVVELIDTERNIGNTLITGSNPVLTTKLLITF